jgi:hypothetical protein
MEIQALPGADARLAAELHRWRGDQPGDGFLLAWLVTARVRAVGRENLDPGLLTALAGIDERHRGADRYLDAFLDAVLAGHRDRRDGPTYLALPLLELIAGDVRSHLDPDRLSALLIADVITRENRDDSPLKPTIRERRTRHAARFVAEAEPGLGFGVPAPPGTAAGEWLSLTVLPVSTAHDEHMFIRALQAYELVFGTLTHTLRAAARLAREGDTSAAVSAVEHADRVFRRASVLPRLLATTRPADVREFGRNRWTTGAELPGAYRDFERAFAEVPADLAGLRTALRSLETSHRRWNTVRQGFARRLLAAETDAAA